MNYKNIYVIIGILVIILIILIVGVSMIRNQPAPVSEKENINPTAPTVTPVYTESEFIITPRTAPSLSPLIIEELRYPVKFEEITVVYKPKTGTFLIYFHGDSAVARASFGRFLDRLNLNSQDFAILYRSLDPVSLPPVISAQ